MFDLVLEGEKHVDHAKANLVSVAMKENKLLIKYLSNHAGLRIRIHIIVLRKSLKPNASLPQRLENMENVNSHGM